MFNFSGVVDSLTWVIARFDNKELAFGISLGILSAAFGIWVFFHFWRHRPFVKPIERLAAELSNIPVDSTAKQEKAKLIFSAASPRLNALWSEYNEHFIKENPDAPKDSGRLNLVDPRLWFSLESLPGRGYEQWCSTWAGVFLTVGLLFTFIGLSAALLKVGGIDGADSAAMKAAITGILGVSSAKFITSIAGLLAYIGFSLVTRRYQSSQRRAAIALADAVQHLSIPRSPELLLFEQNKIASKQLLRLDTFTADLAIAIDGKLKARLDELTAALEAQLGGVRQDLPGATAQPIVAALDGVGEKIGQSNEKGMREMLDAFLDKLQGGAGDKMAEAAAQLAEAAAQLGEVKEGIGGAGKTFGNDIKAAADALREAANQLTRGGEDAGKNLKNSTDAAGTQLKEKIEEVSKKLDSIGGTLAGIPANIDTALNETLKKLTTAIDALVVQMTQGGTKAGENLKKSTDEAGTQLKEKIAEVGNKLDSIGGTLAVIPANIDSALNETLKKLTSVIDALVGRLTQSGEEGGNALRKGGEDAGAGLKTAIDQASRDFDQTLDQATQNLVKQLTDSLGKLEGKIRDFADWLAMTESSFETLRKSVSDQVTNLSAAGRTFATAGETVTKAGDALQQAAAPLQQTVVVLRESINQANQTVMKAAAMHEDMKLTLQNALQQLKATAEAAERTFKTHEERFGRADEALAMALTNLRNGATGIADGLNKAFGEYDQHITKAMKALQNGVDNLSDAIEALANANVLHRPGVSE